VESGVASGEKNYPIFPTSVIMIIEVEMAEDYCHGIQLILDFMELEELLPMGLMLRDFQSRFQKSSDERTLQQQ
jgi:hypothetical protein